MHGKARAEYKAKMRDSKTAALLQQKAEQWHQLVTEIGKRRPTLQGNVDADSSVAIDPKVALTTMALLEKALLVNPDPLYLWNHRREWLVHYLAKDEAGKEAELPKELALTQAALQRNPKAYGAWMHRKWMLMHVQASAAVLQAELELTSQFLKLDERNFHCWNYRRFVVGCLAHFPEQGEEETGGGASVDSSCYTGKWEQPKMGCQVVVPTTSPSSTTKAQEEATVAALPTHLLLSEWEFTTAKIQDNYSNFSAFHYRSQLLLERMRRLSDTQEDSSAAMDELWLTELSLMEDAICTEPDDQTAWWYHAMLLSSATSSNQPASASLELSNLFPMDRLGDRLEEHLSLLRELLEEAPSNKWILLGMHRVLVKLEMTNNNHTTSKEEQTSILQTLQTVDPDRAQRYSELLTRVVA